MSHPQNDAQQNNTPLPVQTSKITIEETQPIDPLIPEITGFLEKELISLKEKKRKNAF